jgi:hypothetical protein
MFRASVSAAVDAPGKFAELNIALAGSLVWSTAIVSVGTSSQRCWLWVSCRNDPPNEKLCEPLSQFSVLSIFQLTVFRGPGAL